MRCTRIAILLIVLVANSVFLVSAPSQVSPVEAAQTCTQLFTNARNNIAKRCSQLDKDFICYGNSKVDITTNVSLARADTFSKVGDMISLDIVDSIKPAPLNLETSEWGVAVLKVQPESVVTSDLKPITFIVYGDVEVKKAFQPLACSGTTAETTSLYTKPDRDAEAIALLQAGTSVSVVAQHPDGAWMLVLSEGKAGWMPLMQLQHECRLSDLPQNDPDKSPAMSVVRTLSYAPGSIQDQCSNIPPDGIIIEDPRGGTRIPLGALEVETITASTTILSIADQERQSQGYWNGGLPHFRPGNAQANNCKWQRITSAKGQIRVKFSNTAFPIRGGYELPVLFCPNANGWAVANEPKIEDIRPSSVNTNLSTGLIQASVGVVPVGTATPTPPPTPTVDPLCNNNGVCDGREHSYVCPQDCGDPPPPYPG